MTIRVGERVTGVVGGLCVVMSMVVFAMITVDTTVLTVLAALALSGIGVGIASPAMTTLVANAVDDANLGVAGAMQQLSSQLGAVLGSVVMTTVQAAREPSGLASSYSAAFTVAACVACGAVVAACFVRPTDRSPRPADVLTGASAAH